MNRKSTLLVLAFLCCALPALAQARRKVIIDQDARGPATTDQQSILVFIQSPEVETLGITVVSGDMWRDEEIAHTLRMLEIIGRTDIPVVPGAVYPLINRMELIERWEGLYGKVRYQGAWNKKPIGDGQRGVFHGPYEVPQLKEGNPTTKPADEDAAHFIIRMVHKYPHEVTIYAGGPLTDIAQAISIDPQVPDLAQELVIMGGAIAPEVPYPWATTNRREFNFWWDPEAVHMVLSAPGWHKITVTTVDISIKTRMGKEMIAEIAKSKNPGAQYLAQYADEEYRWDELAAAAWLDPSIITKQNQLYMDMDYSHGAGYGDTIVWMPGTQPGLGEQLVNVPQELDLPKFDKMFIDLMTRPTPSAHPVAGSK
ncbi:MAG TPA: nucleoside hydrolase [Candidatus Sulfotelmatobacter sp.]|nr:nucleoside hydrolase [Candidatus Sulfotelmatobacter sp.]